MGTRVDVGRLQSISNRLGDAVLDPAQWPVLMQDICSASGAMGACLLQSDVRTPDVPMTDSVREFFKTYFDDRYNENDIRAERAVPLLLEGRQIVSDQDIFTSETEMLRDPLYAHLNSFGLRWFAAVGFFAGPALWGFSIQRTIGEGAFEESEKTALANLSQRLTETATLSTSVGRVVLSNVTNALGFIKRPAIALDRLGSVLEINPLAEALLGGGDINMVGQRLVLRDRRTQAAFNTFLDRLRAASDLDALGVAPIVIRRDGRLPVVIRVLPVDGAARSPFLGARAILIFSGSDGGEAEQLAMLHQAFLLTPSEARIAVCLAGGKSLEEAAQEMAIAQETARSHLKSVFRKTGTHRQGELVALVGRLR
ncbi:MAG: helix-turn-helix transcriptional regulator [Bradyrhizobium sp.]|nr:helix-turn-helix transcriptional regulator [Bradyrhizobium sp.]